MKKLLPILLLTSLFLSSCSIDWDDEKDKKIAELERENESITFEKQRDCWKLQKAMQEQLSENSDAEIMMTFYSPKRNSCLYTSISTDRKTYIWYSIHDFFTKEIIYEGPCSLEEWGNFSECNSAFNNKAKELKWE